MQTIQLTINPLFFEKKVLIFDFGCMRQNLLKFGHKLKKMTAKVIYQGDLRTQMTHLQSGSLVETDAPTDNQGKGERFSPTDLVASALGSCMLSIMGIAARTHEINIIGTEIELTKIMVSNPRKISEIILKMTIKGQESYSDKEKAILENSALTCPVYLSLSEDVTKTIDFIWPT